MQIIESTAYGVRSAVRQFNKDKRHPSVILFPMLHIAEARFFDEISSLLEQCDIILYEGVNSQKTQKLTRVYLEMVKNRKHGLVSQHTMSIDKVRDRLLLADVDGMKLDERWRNLSVFNRWLLPVLAPIIGTYLRWFGSRQTIANYMSLELMKDREELLVHADVEELEELIVDWRDKNLLDVLDQQIAKAAQDEKTCIGVLYGASHMRAVIRHLVNHHRYRPTKSQ